VPPLFPHFLAPVLLHDIRALLATGRYAEAEGALRRRIAQLPGDGAAWHLLGVCLGETGRPHEAVEALDRALALDPTQHDARFARGTALLRLGALAQALAALEDYAARRPDNAWAWNNIGLCHKLLDHPEAALPAFERAIACDPQLALAHANLGNVLVQLGRPVEARAACARALQMQPGNAATRWNLALCRLALGEWPQAWEDYEARWLQRQMPIFAPRGFFDRPRWLGQVDPAGRMLFLHAEQGLGDTLQFCRYAPLLAQRGARVVLEVPAPLQALIGRAFSPAIRVIARGLEIPAFDAHCPLMSLPGAFRTTLATIPAAVPYLRPDPQRCAAWQTHLGPRHRPRLGLVWSSGVSNPRRDVPLTDLLALDRGAWGDWDLIALQPDLHERDRPALQAFTRLRWFGRQLDDFEDTAALLSACDLVVAVDTAAAHLAGALGRPLQVLLPYAADWRWLLDRADSPWYPTARLWRQRAPGEWGTVLQRLGEVLRTWAGPSSGAGTALAAAP